MKIVDRERLAGVVRARRTTLGRTREQVHAMTGLAPNTLRRIEQGDEVRDMSIGQLDVGLDWEPGSAWAVAYGGEPTALGERARVDIDESDPAVQKVRELGLPRERQDEWIREMYEYGLLPSTRPKPKPPKPAAGKRRAG